MPIVSSFFPNEALQGEELPSHIIWNNIEYDYIFLNIPDSFALKEIYNVSEENIEYINNDIKVNKVDAEGYLGLLFKTNILGDDSILEKISYTFCNGEGLVEQLSFEIKLFRPYIVVNKPPDNIYVKMEKEEVSEKIIIRNLGSGTAIVDINLTDESDIVKHYPEYVITFIKEYTERLHKGINFLKSKYDEQLSLLDEIEYRVLNPFVFNADTKEEIEEFIRKLEYAFEENEDMGREISELFVEMIIRNKEFGNVFQLLSEYINSIGSQKLIIRDPLNVINLSEEKVNINIKITCIDLLAQLCFTHTFSPISVHSDKTGEIALFKLFVWGEE